MSNTVSSSWGSLIGNVNRLFRVDYCCCGWFNLCDLWDSCLGDTYDNGNLRINCCDSMDEDIGWSLCLDFDDGLIIQSILNCLYTKNVDWIGDIRMMKSIDPGQIFNLLFYLYINFNVVHLSSHNDNRLFWIVNQITALCVQVIANHNLCSCVWLDHCNCVGVDIVLGCQLDLSWGSGGDNISASSGCNEAGNVLEFNMGFRNVLNVVGLDDGDSLSCYFLFNVDVFNDCWNDSDNNWSNNLSLFIPKINCLALHSFLLQYNCVLSYMLRNDLVFSAHCYCSCLNTVNLINHSWEARVGIDKDINCEVRNEHWIGRSGWWDNSWWFKGHWNNLGDMRSLIVEYNSFNILHFSLFDAFKDKVNLLDGSIVNFNHADHFIGLQLSVCLDDSLDWSLSYRISLDKCWCGDFNDGVSVCISLLDLDAWFWWDHLNFLNVINDNECWDTYTSQSDEVFNTISGDNFQIILDILILDLFQNGENFNTM